MYQVHLDITTLSIIDFYKRDYYAKNLTTLSYLYLKLYSHLNEEKVKLKHQWIGDEHDWLFFSGNDSYFGLIHQLNDGAKEVV